MLVIDAVWKINECQQQNAAGESLAPSVIAKLPDKCMWKTQRPQYYQVYTSVIPQTSGARSSPVNPASSEGCSDPSQTWQHKQEQGPSESILLDAVF